ncbi:MAG: hypothetical protein IM591_10980 [Chitinophagaceae bacterium]|jgi:hypothetical protein|nr:hypothetical protein [Chitinophagaceae bacterium]MCA6491730.1 hypothetical protein [Chitinophagaceae bacterium]
MVRQESRRYNTGSASGGLTCILGPDSNRDGASIQVQCCLVCNWQMHPYLPAGRETRLNEQPQTVSTNRIQQIKSPFDDL